MLTGTQVKDWPPRQHFRERMVRHNQDFHEALPLPFYTHTQVGVSARLCSHGSRVQLRVTCDTSDARMVTLPCPYTACNIVPGPACDPTWLTSTCATMPRLCAQTAPLNLATLLPPWTVPTDLGPKTYVAYGRVGASRCI